ncbi:hypothetical protein HAX54_021570 [Datura stramonium]|uniref:Uncharacterized protein n=1 Tax=Datura stramonium TaxID=4076 RepID=A0ABS8UVA2_DATST|nr:hypothetical protein [Datura stramonium]
MGSANATHISNECSTLVSEVGTTYEAMAPRPPDAAGPSAFGTPRFLLLNNFEHDHLLIGTSTVLFNNLTVVQWALLYNNNVSSSSHMLGLSLAALRSESLLYQFTPAQSQQSNTALAFSQGNISVLVLFAFTWKAKLGDIPFLTHWTKYGHMTFRRFGVKSTIPSLFSASARAI